MTDLIFLASSAGSSYFASQTALAIERAYLAREAERAKLVQATSGWRGRYSSRSRTTCGPPLASITGALSSLRAEEASRGLPDIDGLEVIRRLRE